MDSPLLAFQAVSMNPISDAVTRFSAVARLHAAAVDIAG